jgi:hypothetical protein
MQGGNTSQQVVADTLKRLIGDQLGIFDLSTRTRIDRKAAEEAAKTNISVLNEQNVVLRNLVKYADVFNNAVNVFSKSVEILAGVQTISAAFNLIKSFKALNTALVIGAAGARGSTIPSKVKDWFRDGKAYVSGRKIVPVVAQEVAKEGAEAAAEGAVQRTATKAVAGEAVKNAVKGAVETTAKATSEVVASSFSKLFSFNTLRNTIRFGTRAGLAEIFVGLIDNTLVEPAKAAAETIKEKKNFEVISSAMVGAARGAMIGSFIPAVGPVIGGALGTLAGVVIESVKSTTVKSYREILEQQKALTEDYIAKQREVQKRRQDFERKIIEEQFKLNIISQEEYERKLNELKRQQGESETEISALEKNTDAMIKATRVNLMKKTLEGLHGAFYRATDFSWDRMTLFGGKGYDEDEFRETIVDAFGEDFSLIQKSLHQGLLSMKDGLAQWRTIFCSLTEAEVMEKFKKDELTKEQTLMQTFLY